MTWDLWGYGVPGPGERTAGWDAGEDLSDEDWDELRGYEKEFHDTRHQDTSEFGQLQNRLYDEFTDWWNTSDNARKRNPDFWYMHPNEPITHWLNVEDFLNERHPHAATGGIGGIEDAGKSLDHIIDKGQPLWSGGNATTAAMLALHNKVQGRYHATEDDERRYYQLMLRHVGPNAVRPPRQASHTAHRTAIMANCSDDEYMTGQCAAWAISHQREHPHLRLGIDWQRLTPDHPDWDEEDDGDEAWQPQHIFTHDDHYAYDVRGAHPLSEIRQWDDVTLNHLPEDVMATGMYEGGYEPEPEMVRRVPPHTAHRTAMPTDDYARFLPDIRRIRDGIVADGETNSTGGPSCGVTAEEVAEMLRGQGVAASENYGAFHHPGGGTPEHAWVNLPGGHILDPTADQFGYEPVRLLHPGHPDYARYLNQGGDDDHRHAHRTAMPAQDAYDNFLPHYLRKRETPPAQGEFFHGSDQDYQPGDILESARARGDQHRIDYMENQVGSPSQADWVWMHKHPDHVRNYGRNVYQVEPLDEGPWPWNGPRVDSWDGRPLRDDEPDDPDQEPKRYVSPRARIVRKLNNKKAKIMTAAVTVYTKPSCVQCDMTKKLLDRLGVEHDTVDVTADPDAHAYVTGLGYQAAPVVVVNGGEAHWTGFRPDHLKGLAQ